MITAKGYLKKLLDLQLDGLTGHIEEAGYPFKEVEWGSTDFKVTKKTPNWWVYEQTAYWLDGYLRCGIALNNKEVIDNASRIIYNVILHPDEDSYLGPECIKHEIGARWPHVVFFRACLALYEYNHDERIINALTAHYLNCPVIYDFTPFKKIMDFDIPEGTDVGYTLFRDVINVEIMVNLYKINKNGKLLALALESYKKYNAMDLKFNQINDKIILGKDKIHCHGVTYNEYTKLGALLYSVTGDKYYLDIATTSYRRLVDDYMLPGQLHCSNELTNSSYYFETYETCNISDFTWMSHYMLNILKKHEYGDRIEECVFNGGMGSVLENFRGLQYFSCANQFILDRTSNHVKFSKGKKWMSYRPNPGTECCPGNVNRFMPNYVLNMYLKEEDKIYINLFGASLYEDSINGKKIRIEQVSDFPFTESIDIHIETEVPFTLYIRKTGYASSICVKLNGKKLESFDDDYFGIAIDGDSFIQYSFTSSVEVKKVSSKGLYIRKGVLVYSNGNYGERLIDDKEERSSSLFPAYNIYSDGELGFEVKEDKLNARYVERGGRHFSLKEDLSYIEIDAYKILNLEYDVQHRLRSIDIDSMANKRITYEKGTFTFTPDVLKNDYIVSKKKERIRLYPYGACKIRETVFKIIKQKH